jgi:hypothetical protein
MTAQIKKIILLSIGICFSVSLFAQKDISGIYYNEYGQQIKIKNNKFIFTAQQTHYPIYYNDTLAKCSIKRIDKNLIEINSEPPWYIAMKSLKMVQSIDTTVNADSIKISFAIPYDRGILDISVSTDKFQYFDLSYSKDNKVLMLPKNIKTINFSLSPQQQPVHSPEGIFFGVLYCSFLEYSIEQNMNSIIIEIPAIDNAFFEKYYVKGEYVRIKHNKLVWKGKVYVKEK